MNWGLAFKTAAEALMRIGAFDEEHGSDRLKQTGSYSGFDEPASVQIARDALKAILALDKPEAERSVQYPSTIWDPEEPHRSQAQMQNDAEKAA